MDAEPHICVKNAPDGCELSLKIWLPAEHPKAALALIHGIGEHSGRYHHVARFFQARGYAIFALDLRGHGQSKGNRGHVARFGDYMADAQVLIDLAHEKTPDVPVFLVGHSMGGLITLAYTLKHPDELSGIIVSSPGLRPILSVPGWKIFMGNLLSNLWPSFSMENGIDIRMVTRHPDVIAADGLDPLVHARVSARWFTEFNLTRTWVMEEANTLAVPALILQGGQDQVTDPHAAREIFERIGMDDKHHIEYPELYHEIFNEPEQEDVFHDIEAWLTPRLQPHITD